MKLRRIWALAPLGLAATLVLLLGTVTLGLRLRSAEDPDGLPEAAALDYGAGGFGAFSPLSASFIRDVLGGVIDLPGEGALGTAALGAPVGSASLAPSGTTRVFEHELTDAFGHAFVVPGLPFTAVTDTRGATREPGESSACAPTGGTVWYRYRPDHDTLLSADTFGTAHAVALGIFSGETLSSLRSHGCDSDVSGAAQAIVSASAGRTYYIQITSLVTGGRLVFNLDRHGRTILASESGAPANRESGAGIHDTSNNVVSADGRYVAFPSRASNLVRGDTNGQTDVFVRELATGKITRASVSSTGAQSDDGSNNMGLGPPPSEAPDRTVTSLSISADGRYVAFLSYGRNLVAGDTNHAPSSSSPAHFGGEDAFVRDMRTGRTTRVSVTTSGRQGTQRANGSPQYLLPFGCCAGTAISADGRYVAFTSYWEDLVPGDTNGQGDVFVHDMRTRETTRVSVGTSANRDLGAAGPAMSADGRYVGFSAAPRNGGPTQVFVRDVRTAKTTLASFTQSGGANDASAIRGSISEDGRYVVYQSAGDHIVPGDNNGIIDVFRADLHRRTVVRVSVDSSGREQSAPRNNDAEPGNFTPPLEPMPAVSGDGRFVAFSSPASNLVPKDTNNANDIFVHDAITRRTARVSVSTTGRQGNASSVQGVLSRHGELVVFASLATNLISDDTNGASDVFVRELFPE
jgi:Tol biopolymer transport system component